MRKILSILSKNINQKMLKGSFNNDFAGLCDNSQPGRYILLTTVEEGQLNPRNAGFRPGCNCKSCLDQLRSKGRISDDFFAKEPSKDSLASDSKSTATLKELRKKAILEAKKKKVEKLAAAKKKSPEEVAREKQALKQSLMMFVKWWFQQTNLITLFLFIQLEKQ